MTDYLLGIDIGTTGIKVALFDAEGKLWGSEYREYPLYTPSPYMVEQDPDDWIRALIECTSSLSRSFPQAIRDIRAIGIDGQMHTSALLDASGRVLRRAITWMDQRSKDIVEGMEYKPGREYIFKHTMNFPTTTYLLPNLLWIKENQPQVWDKINKVLMAKDYIKYWLTGEMVTDPSDASGTLLFNIKELKWSEELMNYFSIPSPWFPEVALSTHVIGKVRKEASYLLNIPSGIPVVNGCADHAATYIGGGVISKNEGAAILGTAGVLSFTTDLPVPDPSFRLLTWAHGIPHKWLLLGVMQTAGASLRWFRDSFSLEKESYEVYSSLAEKVPPGSEGLIFLPFLMGERSPYWNPLAKGVFYGITYAHKKAHFIRSIMEGIGFGLKTILDAAESLDVNIERFRILGGGGISKVWQKIISDILDKRIIVVQNKEQAAFGAALLAGVGVGVYSSFENAIDKKIQIDKEILPTYYKVYERNYIIYKDLYEVLKPLYERD